jgi:hypothetical protein
MIQLTDTLQYDTQKPFEQQEQEVQDYINAQMQAPSERNTNAFCGRTEAETWQFNGYSIERKYNYLAPETAVNCFALANTVIIIKTA